MIPALLPVYPWLKTFHIVSFTAWMAGMFYLPRLFVYHTQTVRGSSDSERFKVMERRLMKQIMTPAMLSTWFFGLLLSLTPGVIDWSAGWWHAKLFCVVLMTGLQGAMSRWRRDFLNDRNARGERFYRIANEIPTVLLLVIVIMIVVRP